VDQDWFRSLSTQARENPLLRCEFGLPLDRRVIIAVSKLAPRETPWDLLRAMADPISGSPHLLLAGDGPDKSAVEEFTQKYCGGSVTLAGYVKYSRLAEVYAAGDVFIHCSANEPYGVSVAEALSCGLSVITSSGVGSGYDLIRPSQNGFVYSHGDVSALRACIEAALSLDRRSVEAVNERVLKAWDYGSTWSNILSALEPAER
jgi:glycosyltransferase involved in cell wall biosynthesis